MCRSVGWTVAHPTTQNSPTQKKHKSLRPTLLVDIDSNHLGFSIASCPQECSGNFRTSTWLLDGLKKNPIGANRSCPFFQGFVHLSFIRHGCATSGIQNGDLLEFAWNVFLLHINGNFLRGEWREFLT